MPLKQSMGQVNLIGLEIEIVGLQCSRKPVVLLSLLSHCMPLTNGIMWCNHPLIDYLALNFVAVGITVWRNYEARMLHASAS